MTAKQSIPLRPGRLNRGLISLVKIVPKNSNRPKSRTNGRRSPANVKTANSVGTKSKTLATGILWK